jgi:plastocyanin
MKTKLQVTMISRTVLCWSVCVAALQLSSSVSAQQEGWGNLTGRIVVQGEVPKPAELKIDTPDRNYCIATGQSFEDQSLIVGGNGGLRDAYVMMYFGRGDENRPSVHPSYNESSSTSVALNNRNCRFEPHAIFLRTGQAIEFKNADSIGHNCHIVTMGNEENCSLGAGQSLELKLQSADRVPGIVKCDVHPWMEALILVRDEPYAAISDEEGNFRIENIPAGEWTFQFWHKRSGFLKSLTRDGTPVTGRRGEIKVTIKPDATTDLGELGIAVDELVEK